MRTRKVICEAFAEEVSWSSLSLKRIYVTAETLQEKLEVTLELEVVALARIYSPRLVRLTAHKEGEASVLLVRLEGLAVSFRLE